MFPISDESARRHRYPYVNIALLAINVVVFFYTISLRGENQELFFLRYGLIPDRLMRLPFEPNPYFQFGSMSPEVPAWATLFTSMFIHGGVLHILGNMVFLWVFGDNVESRLGHVPYLIFYLAGGVAAAFSQIAIDPQSLAPVVGASGALAAVLGAYFVLYPFNQIKTIVVFIFITVIRLPAVWLLCFWLVLQFFDGITSLAPGVRGGGVAYWAHIGGFLAGMLAIALLKLVVWREPLVQRRAHPFDAWRLRR